MMNAASSEARNTTAAAMSSGMPWRPSAVLSRYASTMPGSPHSASVAGVRTRPGRDRVDPDPAWTELERGHVHERDDAGLGRAVGRHPPRRLHGIQARDGDDRAAVGHHPRRGLDGEERAREGDVEDAVPVGERVVDDERGDTATRVRHRDVEPAEVLDRERGERNRSLLDRDVTPHDRARLAEGVRDGAQTRPPGCPPRRRDRPRRRCARRWRDRCRRRRR